MDYTIALTEYQEVLVGKRTDWRIIGYKTPAQKQDAAIAIIKYGIEHILQWTPQEAVEHMTPYIAEKLMWGILFQRGMIQDDGIARYMMNGRGMSNDLSKINWKHLMSLCYPDVIHFSQEAEAINEYHRIIAARNLNENGATVKYTRFAKDFLENAGDHREAITSGIFRTFIQEFVVPEMEHTNKGDAHDLFKAFSDSSQMNKLFKRAGLYPIFRNQFIMPYDLLVRYFYKVFGFYAEEDPDTYFWLRVYGLRASRLYTPSSKISSNKFDDEDEVDTDEE